MICAVLALLVFGWMAEGVFSGSFHKFDLESRVLIHQWTSPKLTASMRLASTAGCAAFLTEVSVVILGVLLLTRRQRDAAWFLLLMAGGAVIELTLKFSFHRLRPVPFFGTVFPSYSFPSGHAFASFCFYGQLAMVFTSRRGNRLRRVLVWLLAAVLIVAIGLSRVYLDVHYTTDVIAGYAAAAAWSNALAIVRSSPKVRVRSRLACPTDSSPRTFVLTHGSWQAGWCWKRVADRLRAKVTRSIP